MCLEGRGSHTGPKLSFLEPVFLPLIEQISFGTPEVDNLRTAISVFLLLRALLAVIGVGDAETSANHAPALVGAVVTLVANSHQGTRSHIGIANHTLPVAFLAQAADGNPRLLPAHNQIRMMLRHWAPPLIRILRLPWSSRSLQQLKCKSLNYGDPIETTLKELASNS